MTTPEKQNLKLIEIRNSSEGGVISGSFGKGKTRFKDGAGEKIREAKINKPHANANDIVSLRK